MCSFAIIEQFIATLVQLKDLLAQVLSQLTREKDNWNTEPLSVTQSLILFWHLQDKFLADSCCITLGRSTYCFFCGTLEKSSKTLLQIDTFKCIPDSFLVQHIFLQSFYSLHNSKSPVIMQLKQIIPCKLQTNLGLKKCNDWVYQVPGPSFRLAHQIAGPGK